MNARYFIRTIPSTLNWLAFGALSTLFIKIFWLNEPSDSFAKISQFSVALDGIISSVLASYIFYLIVVHLKEVRDKAVIYPYVLAWARSIVGECEGQLSDLSRLIGHQTTLQNFTENDIESMFQSIGQTVNPPLMLPNGKHASWIQYFDYYQNRSKASISKIMMQLIFVDATLTSCISKVNDCSHFQIISLLHKLGISNPNLSTLAQDFSKYCMTCRDLDVLLSKHAYRVSPKQRPTVGSC